MSRVVALSGFAIFQILELRYNWGLDVISSLIKTLSLWSTDPPEALFLRFSDVGQNLIFLGLMHKGVVEQGLVWELYCMRPFSSPLDPLLMGSTT